MPKGEAGLFVNYCAKDFLDGTHTLGPWEELAYRRICDLIYDTNDRLDNDDRMLAWATKTGRRWPAIKAVLTGGDKPKLLIVDGRITNLRCQSALATAAQKIAQKRGAAAASVASGKSLKNLKQNRTDDRQPVRQPVRTEHRTNQESTESEEEKITLMGDPKEPEAEPSKGDLAEVAAKPKRVAPKRQVPADFWPTIDGISFAAERAGWVNQKLKDEVEHFVDNHRANNRAFADHDRAWKNWVRIGTEKQSKGFRNGRQSAHAAETDAFDAITRH